MNFKKKGCDNLSANRKRNIPIFIRVTEDEHRKILEKIKVSNMNMNRYFINAALRANIIVYDLTSIFDLSSQISHIGNNINQIAKKLNQGERMYNNDINYLKESMRNINDVLSSLYQDMIQNLEEN